ncbi:MAG: hypothetical protein R2748_09790 [Bryobacterales bacterium]
MLRQSVGRFDAILLDVDNGPAALTSSGNSDIYGEPGVARLHRALRPADGWRCGRPGQSGTSNIGCGGRVSKRGPSVCGREETRAVGT